MNKTKVVEMLPLEIEQLTVKVIGITPLLMEKMDESVTEKLIIKNQERCIKKITALKKIRLRVRYIIRRMGT